MTPALLFLLSYFPKDEFCSAKKVPVPDENITDSCYILYNKMLPRFDSDSDIKLLKDKKISRKTNIMYLEKMNWIIKKIIFYIKLDRKQRKIYNKKRRYR